jgi:hypothetical protein
MSKGQGDRSVVPPFFTSNIEKTQKKWDTVPVPMSLQKKTTG